MEMANNQIKSQFKVYNTLTQKKEVLKTIEEGTVKIYVCGPTVYDFIHIGNARPLCVFDVLYRYLTWRGFDVEYAMNFTDIDDKIIKRAAEEGVTYDVISRRYIGEFLVDAKGLNTKEPTYNPRATENIDEIISIVEVLIEKGHAYVSNNGDVYFIAKSFEEYCKLSKQNIDQLESWARIEKNDVKNHPFDFALWKAAKEGEPSWASPWGNGRPGWHIECSAMVKRYLGETIDIHGGGQDLIFPHHENEIAQSECCNGATFAHYWMHNGYINIDNKKMSKSLGNFFTVRDVAGKFGYEPIRYFLISSSYRSPINYTEASLGQSVSALERLYTCLENVEFVISKAEDGEIGADISAQTREKLEDYETHFVEAMDNDLNTADALSVIFDLARDINSLTSSDHKNVADLVAMRDSFTELTGVLGLLYNVKNDNIDDKIEELIAKRTTARANRDFAESDRIRDLLMEMGIVLEDTPSGVKWSKA